MHEQIDCHAQGYGKKTRGHYACGWQLGSLESIHKSEVQQGQQSPTGVLKDNVGNGGDGTLVRSEFL